MILTSEQLNASLQLDNVQRWQAHRKQKKKNVAVHSFRASIIFIYLGGTEITAMLTHDNDEIETGDIPSPAKKHLQGLEHFKRLCVPFQSEKRLSKLADKLELVLDLREQLEDTGHLPKKLMQIYEDELEQAHEIAREIGKTKEVKKLLKEVSGT